MNEFDRLRDDVLSFYLTLVAAIGALLAPTRRRLLDERRDKLAAGRYYVVVCGEFRRGKSSLLNALVERPGAFPVDVDVTTCAVQTLHWSSTEFAMVHYAPADQDASSPAPSPTPIPLDQVREFVTEQGNPGNDKKVLLIEMGAPIPQLESGLVLVDTPGLGSVNPAHTAATRAYLPNADAILFVASAVEPLSVPELDFLRLALAECPIVVAAITMIDKVQDPTPVVTEARSRIATAAEAVPADLVIVPVSSLRKRRALTDGNQELLARSGFPELEAELWGGLAVTCGTAQIEAALDEWTAALAEARAPIDNDLAALRGDAAKAAAELLAEQDRYRRLMADTHTWRRDLQQDIEDAARPVQRQLEGDLERIQYQFTQELSSDQVVGRADAIIQQTSDAMVDAANRANRALEVEMARIADKYRAVTQLAITVSAVPESGAQPGLTAAPPTVRQRPQAYSKFREMWLGASAGMAAGGLIGSIGGFVGAAVGGVVGFFVGLFGGRRFQRDNAREAQHRAYIADLRSNVLPKLDAGRRQLGRGIADQVRNYGRALTNALEDETRAKGESLAESVRLLEQTQRQDARGRAVRERELVRQQQDLDGLAAGIGRLRSRTRALSRGKSGRTSGA
jgi:hypothetical protein